MAIVDSLKKLLVKFGGNPSALEENATSSDVIDAITEAYTDKEGTYTEVTPIITKGTKIATITTNNTPHDIYVDRNDYYLANSVSGTSVTLTKDTLANVANLYLSGKQILLEIISSGIRSILSLSTCDIDIPIMPGDQPYYKYVFTGIFVDGDDNKIITVTFNNSTTGTMAVKTVPAGGGDGTIVIVDGELTGGGQFTFSNNVTIADVWNFYNSEHKIPIIRCGGVFYNLDQFSHDESGNRYTARWSRFDSVGANRLTVKSLYFSAVLGTTKQVFGSTADITISNS